ncbi:coenzyme F420-0:L-glutamate ligase [Candidatus Nomurabacteria bacterium]|nr:coenzyme F420-0:L-glutamate ligase [Candidatus Nomurabacteria bacterium]
MIVKAYRTRIFKENENLIDFIVKYIPKAKDGDIIVVTSKIVALSEGRTEVLGDHKHREALIKKESTFAIKTKYTWLTIKDGMVMSSAGIDESNADGKIVLLPYDSFKSAKSIHFKLSKIYKVKNLGILITDSRLLPLRAGVVGIALGYAGFKGVRDYRGKKDMFGRVLKFSRTDVADSLATSAVVCMGEGDEKQPLAKISNAPVDFVKNVNRKELVMDPSEDVYAPIFQALKKQKFGKKD